MVWDRAGRSGRAEGVALFASIVLLFIGFLANLLIALRTIPPDS
jgi:hypothetical protein